MVDERWNDVTRLYHEAAQLPVEQRANFLRQACGGDDALHAEVDSLLRYREQPLEFLDNPGIAGRIAIQPETLIADDCADPVIGRVFGRYRVERRIGGGGMGTVYYATRSDEYLNQAAAVKVLHHHTMDADELRQRFAVERQTQANLNHPNIARLLDAGVTSDRLPYLIIEHIDGLPIDDYCDQNHLTIEARLRLFQTVCASVHFAHQNLVVHRDLKPGNIMVTREGVPKLLDFGVAKVLEPLDGDAAGAAMAASQTATMRQMLSIDYASPEQISGDRVTTETDVYSLGVILYELLVGRRPYRLTSRRLEEIERIICATEPRRPSTAVKSLTRRGEGAGSTPAADERIAAGLADGQTRAAADESSQSAAPAPAAGARDASPALSVLTLPSEEIARLRSTSLDRLGRDLRGDLDNIILMAMRKEPHRRYSSAQQLSEDIQRYLDGHPVLARKDTVLYRASKFVRRNRLSVSAAAIVAVALVAATIITTRQARIAADQRDAAALAQAAAEREADHARIEAASANQVADFLIDALLVSAPRRSPEELAAATPLLDRHITRVRLQYADQPHLRANLLDALGRVHLNLNLHERAAQLIQEAAVIRDEHFTSRSLEYALSLNSLGELSYARGEHVRAVEHFRQALHLHQTLPAGVHTDIAMASNNLAAALRAMGKLDEAEALHRRALELRRQGFGDRSPLVAESLNNLALIDSALGRHDQAQARLSEALDIRRASLGDAHPLVAQTLANMATAHLQAGDLDAAEPLLREAIDRYRTIPGAAADEHARCSRHLAEILRRRGELAEASQLLEQAMASLRQAFGPDHLNAALMHESLALLKESQGDNDAAELHWRQTLRIRTAALPDSHFLRANALSGLARLLMHTDRPDQAIELLEDALDAYAESLPPEHVFAATAKVNLGSCLLRLKQYDRAEALVREGYETLLASRGPDAAETAAARRHLLTVYEATGASERASELQPH